MMVNKYLIRVLLFLSMSLVCRGSETFGDFTYESVEAEVWITSFPRGYVGEVEVPAEINNLPVTTIARHSFFGCSQITSVRLPDSVLTIGDGAFRECFALEEIQLSENITSLGERAFTSCHRLRQIEIPASVTEIREATFHYCSDLTTVDLHNGLEVIGRGAFWNCTRLKEINIPASVMNIGEIAFARCEHLRSVKIPEGVRVIGSQTFFNCKQLVEVSLPVSLTKIEYEAFLGCSSLFGIELPSSLRTIERYAFMNCSQLQKLVLPSGLTSMGQHVIRESSSVKFLEFRGVAPVLHEEMFLLNSPNLTVYVHEGLSGFDFNEPDGVPVVTVPSGESADFLQWHKENEVTYGTGLETDLGGVSLLVAYALDIDLSRPVPDQLPAIQMQGEAVSLEYFAGRPDIDYVFESSVNLNKWERPENLTSSTDDRLLKTASVPRLPRKQFLRIAVKKAEIAN